jgi:hypothetical protein
MNNRRDFLKLTGLTGLGLLGAPILPGFARPQKDNSEPIPAENTFEEDAASPGTVLEPAPQWMQNADMFSSAPWYVAAGKSSGENAVWRAYDMEFRDVPVKQKVRIASANVLKEISAKVPVVKNGTLDGAALKGVAMISHAPVSELAFKQAHEQGFRIIPYVHFTDIHTYYADQDIFHFEHPEVLLRNQEGKWAHLPMDNSERFNRFLTCANNPVYCKLSLDYIKKLMDWGADGLFIDNVFNRQECTAAKIKHTSPEFSPYVHDHIYPEATHNYAFNRFLESVRKLVKSYGADKVVVLNSGIGACGNPLSLAGHGKEDLRNIPGLKLRKRQRKTNGISREDAGLRPCRQLTRRRRIVKMTRFGRLQRQGSWISSGGQSWAVRGPKYCTTPI